MINDHNRPYFIFYYCFPSCMLVVVEFQHTYYLYFLFVLLNLIFKHLMAEWHVIDFSFFFQIKYFV